VRRRLFATISVDGLAQLTFASLLLKLHWKPLPRLFRARRHWRF
jgi:hypothetical protein